jgi:hypothetical protein
MSDINVRKKTTTFNEFFILVNNKLVICKTNDMTTLNCDFLKITLLSHPSLLLVWVPFVREK